ncbi:MAG: type II secretion system protein [Planctomycetes bacterium]|nr:type II secretion system protein [Planctomycetota bacterium]
MSHLLKSRSRYSAFTLIELLVVIAIIGILVSLTSVGVVKILNRGQMVAARTEISQLEAAIAAAKQNFGNVDELPSIIELYSSGPNFQAAANATNAMTGLPTNPNTRNTFNFFTKVFGKNWYSTTVIPWLGSSVTAASYSAAPKKLLGMEALVFLLGGFADSSSGAPNFVGFSSNPLNPMDVTNTKYKTKGPFYEFKQKQIIPGTSYYTMVNNTGGSYAYFSSSDYAYFLANPLGGIVYPYHKSPSPPVASSSYYNPKTFQIISSGQDKLFGSGGYYAPPYTTGQPVFDDISNFSSLQLGAKE